MKTKTRLPVAKLEPVSHGLVDVPGFLCSGVACGIRGSESERLDLALIHSRFPCQAAGVFTRNSFRAAPVLISEESLAARQPIHAIVANSGNANACTGRDGYRDGLEMRELAANALGISACRVLVASTGRIGRRLPMKAVAKGVQAAASVLGDGPSQGMACADAILTSDSCRKVATARVKIGGDVVTVAGMAKGAGMIEPHMATMLAFLATDAAIGRGRLRSVLRAAVGSSFNAITVDGDQSTNDTVFLLANGKSGCRISDASSLGAFSAAVQAVCADLADRIVSDGEKITKVVEVKVLGARRRAEAEAVARAIGNSLLVKSSWFGNDPNWGRILDAAGYSGVAIDPLAVKLAYRSTDTSRGSGRAVPVFRGGEPILRLEHEWREVVKAKRFTILFDLGAGEEEYRLLATDLTEEYVNFNKSE